MTPTSLCPVCCEAIEADAKACPHCRKNFVGVWRKGKTLVMRREAKLPDRCIKSNLPAETHLSRTLTWHPGWVYLLVLLWFFAYIIAVVMIQKTAKVNIGLTNAVAKKRRQNILVAWLVALASLGTIISGSATLKGVSPMITLIVGIILMGGIIFVMIRARMITVVKVTDDYVWFNGVCLEYLDELPEWEA